MEHSKPSSLSAFSTANAGLIQGRAYRNLNREFSAYLGEFGFSLTDWALVGLIASNDGVSQIDLAAELDVTAPMAAKAIAGLERKGYVGRRTGDSDNRVKLVSITPAGVALVGKVEPVLRERMAHLLAGVSREDLLAYLRVLAALSQRIQ